MNGERLKAALQAGDRVCGTMFVQTRVGNGDHRLREVGLDFVIVGNEHSPYSRAETAAWMHVTAKLHAAENCIEFLVAGLGGVEVAAGDLKRGLSSGRC